MTLLSDRIDDYQHAELQRQVRDQRNRFHRKQRGRVRYLTGQIRKGDPWRVVQKLKAFGGGVQFIIETFENAIVELEQRGYFEPEGVEGLILLSGLKPDDATICRHKLAYSITVNNLGCVPDQPAPDLAKWLEPINRPFPLRNKPREAIMGANADACRANLVKIIRDALIPLRELHARVVKEVDEPLLQEELQRASILAEPAARRVSRGLTDVRLTFHKSWRDLVEDLETGGPPRGSDPDEEEEGIDQGKNDDQEQDGEAGVTAEAPAEAVIEDNQDQDQDQEQDQDQDQDQDRDGEAAPVGAVHDGTAAVWTGAEGALERGCVDGAEFLPFQPEKIVEQSAQLPESVAVTVEFLAARVQGAKMELSGDEGGPNGVENGPGGPGCRGAGPAAQVGLVGVAADEEATGDALGESRLAAVTDSIMAMPSDAVTNESNDLPASIIRPEWTDRTRRSACRGEEWLVSSDDDKRAAERVPLAATDAAHESPGATGDPPPAGRPPSSDPLVAAIETYGLGSPRASPSTMHEPLPAWIAKHPGKHDAERRPYHPRE